MQKGQTLQFHCVECEQAVHFSIFQLSQLIKCTHCGKEYVLTDEVLRRQIKKFEALCRQIQESQEILGSTHVGVDVGEHHVKIPYKILLSRFTSTLELQMGEKVLSISFRLEPSIDLSTPEGVIL